MLNCSFCWLSQVLWNFYVHIFLEWEILVSSLFSVLWPFLSTEHFYFFLYWPLDLNWWCEALVLHAILDIAEWPKDPSFGWETRSASSGFPGMQILTSHCLLVAAYLQIAFLGWQDVVLCREWGSCLLLCMEELLVTIIA